MTEQKSTLSILDWLAERQGSPATPELATLSEWKALFDDAVSGFGTPVDRAVIGGFLADRTAYAFAAGYESGLRRLVPALPEKTIVSLCVTEDKGGHPSTIRTSLQEPPEPGAPCIVSGSKKFITMANEAELLLVAASTGVTAEGKNRIRMVLVNRTAPGVEISVMTGLPFVPEISHGTVVFRDVPVDESSLLPGDGYSDYIRPFRTIEDLHVFAAIAGFIYGTASRYRWPREIREETAALIVCTRTLALDNPSSPAVHIALGGLHRQIISLLEKTAACWEMVDEKTRAAWTRDRALLTVAETARRKRLETAWSHYR